MDEKTDESDTSGGPTHEVDYAISVLRVAANRLGSFEWQGAQLDPHEAVETVIRALWPRRAAIFEGVNDLALLSLDRARRRELATCAEIMGLPQRRADAALRAEVEQLAKDLKWQEGESAGLRRQRRKMLEEHVAEVERLKRERADERAGRLHNLHECELLRGQLREATTARVQLTRERDAENTHLRLQRRRAEVAEERAEKAERTVAMLRVALDESKRETVDARAAGADEEPWIWSDDDTAESVESLGHTMVVRITGGHLRALIRAGRGVAERERDLAQFGLVAMQKGEHRLLDLIERIKDTRDAARRALVRERCIHDTGGPDGDRRTHAEIAAQDFDWGYLYPEGPNAEPDQDPTTFGGGDALLGQAFSFEGMMEDADRYLFAQTGQRLRPKPGAEASLRVWANTWLEVHEDADHAEPREHEPLAPRCRDLGECRRGYEGAPDEQRCSGSCLDIRGEPSE